MKRWISKRIEQYCIEEAITIEELILLIEDGLVKEEMMRTLNFIRDSREEEKKDVKP